MLGQLLLRSYHRAAYQESFFFSSATITLQLVFASLSLLHLRFGFIMLSKGSIINNKTRRNNMTQVTTVTA
jgi:hypothetical protein